MVPDQTQLRSKTFLIRPNCARTVYDQTQLRSNALLIRPNCARTLYDQIQLRSNSLWSDPSALEEVMIRLSRPKWPLIRPSPDHDQTVVRSKFGKDPVISVWEHTGVRSTGSDQKSIWVWTSTWAISLGADTERTNSQIRWNGNAEFQQSLIWINCTTTVFTMLPSFQCLQCLQQGFLATGMTCTMNTTDVSQWKHITSIKNSMVDIINARTIIKKRGKMIDHLDQIGVCRTEIVFCSRVYFAERFYNLSWCENLSVFAVHFHY